MYKVGKDWKPMDVVKERIQVKVPGEVKHYVDLRFTKHGPVIHHDHRLGRAYVLKWAGSEPGGAAYLPALAVSRSQNHQEFLKALEHWKIPSLNFMYADKDDNIAWVAAAATPVRPKHDGLLPVPGNDGYDWAGYLTVKDLPQDLNPKSGWLATANHNILPKGYKHEIAYEFASPYRFLRVKANLEGKQKLTLEDFQKIQHDHVSIPGRELASLLAGHIFKHETDGRAAEIMLRWNGDLSRDSEAGLIFAHWLPILQEHVYGRHVPKALVKEVAVKSGMETLVRILKNPDEKWFGPDPLQARRSAVATSFSLAVQKIEDRWPDLKGIRWGAVHTATFRHLLASMDPQYAKLFNVGPYERAGDGNTPNNTRYNEKFEQIHGATYRHVFDLADWDKGLATSAPGQSGQYGSPHYADLAPLWGNDQYFPLVYSRAKVEEVTQNKLFLRP